MLNNEQRAHDMAIATLPRSLSENSTELRAVTEYLKLYNEYLRLLSLSDEQREQLAQSEDFVVQQ